MKKTGSYKKDGQLWKRRTVKEKTDSYGKDRQLCKTGSCEKDGQLQCLLSMRIGPRKTP